MMRRQSDFQVPLAFVLVELRCVISNSENGKPFVSGLTRYVNRGVNRGKSWGTYPVFSGPISFLVFGPKLPSDPL